MPKLYASPLGSDPLRFRAEQSTEQVIIGGVRSAAVDLYWEWECADPSIWEQVARQSVSIFRSDEGFIGVASRNPKLCHTSLAFPEPVLGGLRPWQLDQSERFQERVVEEHDGSRHISTRYQFGPRSLIEPASAGGHPVPADAEIVLLRTITILFPPDDAPAGVPALVRVRITDRALTRTPASLLYYTLTWLRADEDGGNFWYYASSTQASVRIALAGQHDLYSQLTQLHRELDRSGPPDGVPIADRLRGKGQLQRLLDVFSAFADLLHGQSLALRDLLNPVRTDPRALPLLAAMLGWRLDPQQDIESQRQELRALPDLFLEIGTAGLLCAMLRRWTGWSVEVRELARNVLCSVDTSRFVELPTAQGNKRLYADGWLGVASPEGSPQWEGNALPPGTLDTQAAGASHVPLREYLGRYEATDRIARVLDLRCPSSAAEAIYVPKAGRGTPPPYNPRIVLLYLAEIQPGEQSFSALSAKWHAVWPRLRELCPVHVIPFLIVTADVTAPPPR